MPKKYATSPHVIIQNFVTLGLTVLAEVGDPKVWGHSGPTPFRWGCG